MRFTLIQYALVSLTCYLCSNPYLSDRVWCPSRDVPISSTINVNVRSVQYFELIVIEPFSDSVPEQILKDKS